MKMKEKWKKMLSVPCKRCYWGERKGGELSPEGVQVKRKQLRGSGLCRGQQCGEQEPLATANHRAELPSPSLSASRGYRHPLSWVFWWDVAARLGALPPHGHSLHLTPVCASPCCSSVLATPSWPPTPWQLPQSMLKPCFKRCHVNGF